MAPIKTNENIRTARPFTLCCGLLFPLFILIFVGVSFDADAMLANDSITLFAVVRQESAVWVKVAEQDNFPLLEENDNPQGGPWTWDIITQPSGFTGSPTVSLTPDGVDGRTVQISWVNFAVGDWRDGRNGTFEVQLTDGNSNTRGPYTVNLALRSIPWLDFTVIEGQSGAGDDAVRQSPPFGGGWEFSATPQPGYGITFAGNGRISVAHAGDWSNKSTTFELTISDGVSGHPASTFDGSRAGVGNVSLPTVTLRKLMGDGYTIIAGQSSGGNGISADAATGAGNFVFSPSNLPTGVSLTLGNMGRVTAFGGTNSGTFDLDVQDGGRPSSSFMGRRIDFRSLVGDGYTLIAGQSSGDNGISADAATGAGNFVFSPSNLPTGVSLTLGNMGQVTAFGGTNSGTFDLDIQDGARPASSFAGRRIDFRSLVGDGYTLIAGQSSGGDGISADAATGAGNFVFSPSNLPTGVSLTLGQMGEVTAFGGSNSGTFDLDVQDGGRPSSSFMGRRIDFRSLVGDGYTVFKQQASGGLGVNAPGAYGYIFSVSNAPSGVSLALDSMGAVVSCSSANWKLDATFDVEVADGNRPSSFFTNRALSLRSLVPDPLTIPDNGRAGSINPQVQGDVGPWDWSDYEDGLANSVLTASDSLGTSSLAISWVAGAVESGETGTGTVTIQRSNGSSPASTVNIETAVIEAPQMPVSYWPILAVMLLAVAVTRIRRDEGSPER